MSSYLIFFIIAVFIIIFFFYQFDSISKHFHNYTYF